jgi:hypothetical protein
MYVLNLFMILMKLNFSWKIYLRKENSSGSLSEGVLLAVGGRYDYLLHQLRSSDYVGYAFKFNFFLMPLTRPVSSILIFLFTILTVEHSSRMFEITYFYVFLTIIYNLILVCFDP